MSFGALKRRKTGSPDVNLCTSSPELSQKSGPKAPPTEKPSLAPPIPRTWSEGTFQGEGRPTIGKEDAILDGHTIEGEDAVAPPIGVNVAIAFHRRS